MNMNTNMELSGSNTNATTSAHSMLDSSALGSVEWLQQMCRTVAGHQQQQQQPFAGETRCFSALSTRGDESGYTQQSGARLVKASHYLQPLWSDCKENPYALLMLMLKAFELLAAVFYEQIH